MATASPVVALGLAIFWGVSLHNVLKHKDTQGSRSESPLSPEFLMALIGSLAMFAEALAFIVLEITGGIIKVFDLSTLLGLVVFFLGCVLHAWSVAVRGRYATSWGMLDDQMLITAPPYSYIRHPSYLAYMLMIIGFTAVWRIWFTLIPWIAIPGYVLVSRREEELLLERFGEEYRQYMEHVGAFIPRL